MVKISSISQYVRKMQQFLLGCVSVHDKVLFHKLQEAHLWGKLHFKTTGTYSINISSHKIKYNILIYFQRMKMLTYSLTIVRRHATRLLLFFPVRDE
jgi:hypothetical protein